MGAPEQEAYEERKKFIRSFRKFLTTSNFASAQKVLDAFALYLQRSGIVQRYDKPLESHYWGIEFQDSMKSRLREMNLAKTRRLMVKVRIFVPNHGVTSVLLDRAAPHWILIKRTEFFHNVGPLSYSPLVDSAALLKACCVNSNEKINEFVKSFINDACHQLHELIQEKEQQLREDRDEALLIQGFCDLM